MARKRIVSFTCVRNPSQEVNVEAGSHLVARRLPFGVLEGGAGFLLGAAVVEAAVGVGVDVTLRLVAAFYSAVDWTLGVVP